MAEATGTSSNRGGLGSGGVRVPQEPSLKTGVVLSDERVDFLREQAFCVLRVKTDKWNRFIGAEENQKIILDFLDHIWTNRLLLFTGPGGTLHAGDAQTSPPWKTKLLCVLKRGVKRIARQGFRHQLRLGEVPGYPMEHLPVVISEVLVCVLSNGLNHEDWPRVVSDDIHRHLEKLRNKVVTLRGRAEGRTLLPLPLCVERTRPQDIILSPTGWPLDRGLLYSIETLIVQWSGQIWNVLKKDSGMVLLQGDHPGPNVELHFWTTQRENLLGIQSQIQSPKAEHIMEILRRVKSSYYSSFKDICLKVNEAVMEAEDIDLYLRPLRRLISSLEEISFPRVDTLLPPLFHTLCLIWSRSQYYCTPKRMVVLLQEFCNMIIEKAFAYLIPEELFKMELEEGVERVQITISVLRTFKQLFHTHRQQIPKYYKDTETIKLWDFPATLVFQRSDRIMERLLMIEELFATALDFLKLEKVELGGSRGKILSEMVFSMSEEFHDHWRALRESKYDPLDYTDDDFVRQYRRFMEQSRDFDHRLGTVLNLAFHHSKNLKSTFKLLKIFSTLLERPRIHQLFSPNYSVLLTMFNQEVDHCQFILDQHKDGLQSGCAVLGKNMPSVAGNLKWSQELRNRILTDRSNLCQLAHMPLGCAEADDVLLKCEHVLEVLDQHDQELFSEWTQGLEEICQTHLKEPLLTLDTDTGLFQLTSVLREVKYLSIMKNQNIPEAALHLYSKRERLYMYTQTLTLVTQWYNQLHSTILAVELGLVKGEMDKTRHQLDPALRELTWAQDDLWDYIQSTRDLVKSISTRVQKSKANVEAIQALMGKFSHRAFITRKSRGSTLLVFSDIEESVSKQHTLIRSTGEQLHQLLQGNQSLLGVSDLDSSEWQAYTDYVDRMILTGFSNAVRCSLQYFLDNTDAAQRITPLFEVQLVLNSNEMTFDPPLDYSHSGNFYDIVDKMVANITNMALFIPRVAKHKKRDNYQCDINEMEDLSEMCHVIRSRARAAVGKVREYQGSFASYRYLWTDDRSEFMRQFLLYGHVLSTEEAELYADYELKKNPPTLDNFKDQINLFESLYVRVSKMEDKRVFGGWLQLDIRPFKLTLMNVIKRWSWMFKEHLLNHVNQSVRELSSFVQDTAHGLSKKVSDGDYAGLVDIMGHLMAIRDRQISNEQHFKPLKSTAELLKTYGQQLPESVYTQLEVKQHEFREQFRTESIFRINVEEPYKLIDKSNRTVAEMEAEMQKLQDTADLFEVSFPDYKQLRQCRSDIILVKAVWDMVIFVKTSIEDWTKTPWKEINVEQMDMELRRFAKEMKLDKEARVWDVYMGLESTVKNLLTSLRAVNELQNSAIRERHWQQLMNTTRVQLQNILMSKYVEYFQAEVSGWQRKLMVADLVISSWMSVQRTWAHLNSIFTNSHDIRCQLANDAERFQGIHTDFQSLMTEVVQNSNVVEVTNHPGFLENLETLQQRLSVCEKALAEYLETKRLTFPRFYFVSASDLLEIVSKGTQPKQVTRHLLKLFDNIADLRFKDSDRQRKEEEDGEAVALGMYSREGEYVPFSEPCVFEGQAECWLSSLENTMRCTVRKEIQEAVAAYEDKPRDQWLFDYPAQVGLTGSQVWWATDVGIAFERVEEGFETALKDYNRKQVTTGQAFAWLSQLRHRWDDENRHCYVNICDAQFQFSYEYLGNTNRLVITPLTDRCYITLTQSLHLTMSGAPSGPAGTGKTETTKDLGRSLGIMVYVFNCSEQMDYKATFIRAWLRQECGDALMSFNRISVEVLSVVAVQVKTIQDAVRNKKQRFHFLGEEIELKPTVGIFITLNPGYAGRAELPENLKALFRPCAMVIPDFELICEIMLVAEGFIDARLLARKFISLYTLCKELLSKQDHYDWGLRAIKSVLVVAGSLKREDRNRPEEQVLMRALRDFNLPKIVTSDVPIFLGLISDLFPLLDVPRKRDPELENAVRQSVSELRLQPEENFILKVTQLEELLAVRHSVFVVGGPGTGKSQILKTLHRTYANMKMKPVWSDINPKAVTTDELFGYLHPATREWKDGLFSSTMRELTSVGHDGPKWIVLDGDIDPMWIESLNTVMDDNKVLTLASNERISLSSSMRLLFEISHLKAATPATVSRAGILFVNPQDLGWSSYVTSWIDTRQAQSERANLTILFDKYVPYCLEQVRCNLKTITPIPENSMVQTLCSLLDCLLTEDNTPADSPRELYEIYFVFACVWAFGGALFQDHLNDYRAEFSRWWSKEMRAVKFPSQGTVFDYFIDSETKKFTPWSEKMEPFELEPDVPLQTVLVHTPETICLTYFMDLLLQRGKPIMLVGNAGVGKTILVSDKVAKLKEDYMVAKVPFNYYTTSAMLQRVLEKPLEKKAGRKFAPPTGKTLIYFIDDLNMPEVDVYGTVQPHTLIRQHLDYNHCADALATIFSSILSAHFLQGGFSYGVSRSVGTLIQAAICLHQKVSQNFLPTAIRFHYIFNLRDLSNIFQGILFALPESIRYPMDLVHLWLHESSRVYSDKLMEEKDVELFNKILLDTGKRYFEASDWEKLQKTLADALEHYNELHAVMDLVLFEEAIQHVCRISRILEAPYGNALLVGVGGSGKQSLCRLAAFLSMLEVFQITLRKGYGINDLKSDIAALYIKVGVKNIGTVFLHTDAQIPDERFLVLINDMLASGDIPDLFSDEEVDMIVTSIRMELRGLGLIDSRDNCWSFFIERIRRQLKVVLCFSPVGFTLRTRARKFPALVNCTAIDWFHPWPQLALQSVSSTFIEKIPGLEPNVRASISEFISYAHTSVNEVNIKYQQNEKHFNYTTPKSFLEFMKLYGNLLGKKRTELTQKMERLENGLQKLQTTASQVEDLKAKLAVQEVELWQRNTDIEALLDKIGQQTDKLNQERAVADEEEQKVAAIQAEVTKQQQETEEDLAKAEPALQAANAALNTLNRLNLTELRTFPNPPAIVTNVSAAVLVLLSPQGRIPKDRSWKASKMVMSKVDDFLQALVNFDKEHIPEATVRCVRDEHLSDPEFNPEFVRQKSSAAAGLCAWVINIIRFHEANADLAEAAEKLEVIRKKLAELDSSLETLTTAFEKATSEKLRFQEEVNRTNKTIELANRLVKGLESENVRWAHSVAQYHEQEETLSGDVLLTAAFISYAGSFSKKYRKELLDNLWMPFLRSQKLQGIKWIKSRYGNNLKVISLGQRGYVDVIEQAVVAGDTVLIENLEETIDPVIDPLLGRHTIKKGSCIKVGDKECFFHPGFRLILHTKLANPHYKPEIQAQTTLINFTVTRDGLEDQLLAQVVNQERPDLEHLKSELTKQQNMFKIELKLLEDELLTRLSAADSNFLGDNVLVEKLETTKHTAAEIEMKVLEAKVNEVMINEAREHYRPVAVRASLLYFIMNDLNKINAMYQFSLKAFNVVFHKAVAMAEAAEDVKSRVNILIDCVTYSTFNYISRGLFERDKLTFTAQLAFQVMSFTDEFRGLDRDIEGSPKRWKKMVESECPEKEKFPQEWKGKSSLQKLIMMRALRPDRMTYALRNFVEEKLGVKYTEGRKTEFAKSFRESGPASPVFFILSPGVDPLKDVESLGGKLGFTIDLGKLHNVSLGQGQEAVAEVAMEKAAKEGHWVILQGILENAIKITNEPPTGMLANLHAALDNFDQDILDQCSREQEFKTILFSLCYFHACVAERRKFGPQGWNRKYPFNTGDLTISVNVLYNYLEANAQVPWEDLRYLFGEIMYGGHITDDWDRRLCRTYLEEYMQPNQFDRKLALAPGFVVPSNLDYQGYHDFIDEMLPHESPVHYGLHPNAEIEFLTVTSDNLFHTLLELQSPDAVMGEGASQTLEEKVKTILDEVLEKLPEEYNMSDITSKTAERSPYILVCFQECERMNTLIFEIRRSLKELDLGLKVCLYLCV
ncbi:Dynein heavy chain 11, axonemal [Collichthys lucidus]|uniref:Dynein heavy chain 11, axonemal n=1 Tax=Collichthys lucidus TaxID=240159 RepID=A0A4U5UXV9_COLLU|nr:Dynein heavy chain 11, axonemal [Collichthys lucidus]